MYQVNEVLNLDGSKYRILKTTGNNIIWIELDNSKALPVLESLNSLEQLVADEKLIRVEDPYAYLLKEFPEQGSKALQIRDKNFRILKPLIDEPNFYLLEVSGKGKRRHAKGKKLGRPRIYTEGVGAIVDDATEKLFRILIDKYLLSKNEFSLPFAHRVIIPFLGKLLLFCGAAV